jgi:sporulation protein YlmC with PRC-barrel domain
VTHINQSTTPARDGIRRTTVMNEHGQYIGTIRHAPFDPELGRMRAVLIKGFEIASKGGRK